MSNFQKTASYTGQFKDVWSGAWYADSAKICYEYGLMQGTYGKFNPRGTVSVAEALTLSCRIHEVYNNGKSAVKSGSGANWYRPYVEYAVKEGLIQAGILTIIPAPPPGQRWLTSLPTPSRRRSCTPSTESII